jgi:hypothetical protein
VQSGDDDGDSSLLMTSSSHEYSDEGEERVYSAVGEL